MIINKITRTGIVCSDCQTMILFQPSAEPKTEIKCPVCEKDMKMEYECAAKATKTYNEAMDCIRHSQAIYKTYFEHDDI